MKITAKTTKQELANVLGANSSLVKKSDKELFDRLNYASKMFKKDETKVTKKDLADLVRATIKSLGDKFIEPALAEEKVEEPKTAEKTKEVNKAENSIKKLGKSKSAPKTEEKTEEVESEPSEDAKETAKEEPKKSASKKDTKKGDSKKKLTKKEENKNEAELIAEMEFPNEIEVDDVKYELAHDIKSMEDLYNAVNEEDAPAIVFAFHWTKAQIKVFNYYGGQLPTPKSFPNDLDLATCIWASDSYVVAYAISMYTEANYCVLPEDFEEEDGVRYCQGIDYQLYREVQ